MGALPLREETVGARGAGELDDGGAVECDAGIASDFCSSLADVSTVDARVSRTLMKTASGANSRKNRSVMVGSKFLGSCLCLDVGKSSFGASSMFFACRSDDVSKEPTR